MIIGINFFRCFLQLVYNVIKILPVKNKIVMISRQSNEPNIDFCLLKEELQDDFEIIFLCRTLDDGIHATLKTKILYCFHMLRQMYHLATAKVAILDSYCIIASLLKHKKQLKIIQIWHSIGTMKLFGYSALGTKEGSSVKLSKAMHMHENYDYVFASSYAYADHLAAGFNCPLDKIKEFPLPRVDLLKDLEYQKELSEKIYSVYPQLKEGKNIVYCPTFRKGVDQAQKHVELLYSSVPKGYHLIVKLHPLSKVSLDELNIFVCKEFSTAQLFSIADAVISDYSCVVYEAAIRNIPIYFYAYDLKDYLHDRGLAIDYKNELPGTISTDADKIIDDIVNQPYDFNKLNAFCKKYVKETSHATQDIGNFIRSIVRD